MFQAFEADAPAVGPEPLPVGDEDQRLPHLEKGAELPRLPVRGKKLETLRYGQLDEAEYRKLKPCLACAAPLRAHLIREFNLNYAEGKDHDPVLTEARKNCPRKLKGK